VKSILAKINSLKRFTKLTSLTFARNLLTSLAPLEPLRELNLRSLTVRDNPCVVDRTPGFLRVQGLRLFPTLEYFNGTRLDDLKSDAGFEPLLRKTAHASPANEGAATRWTDAAIVEGLIAHAVLQAEKLELLDVQMEETLEEIITEAVLDARDPSRILSSLV